jgi:hypothetical protein
VKLDLTRLTDAEVAATRVWTDAYRAHQDLFRGVSYPLLADPLDARWTGLQVWDRAAQRGVVLAFRQDDPSATALLALHAVDGHQYVVRDLLTGDRLAVVSGAELRSGWQVTAGRTRQVVALVVEEAGS